MDLNAPLGVRPPKPARPRYGLWTCAAFAAAAVTGAGTYLAMSDPHGGEPYAVADLKAAAPRTPEKTAPLDPAPTASVQRDNSRQILDDGHIENGVKVYRGRQGDGVASSGDGAETTPLVIDVSKALDEAARKSSKRPLSDTRSPSLFPSDKSAAANAAKPRIAIFVGGLGLSQSSTRTATEIMPPAVTFAFVPYGDKVAAEVDAAKAKGHEILLQLPMQNANGSAPGPHALRAGPAAAIDADLAWLMGRFGAYDGVTNLLGAPVTSNPATMTAILRNVGGRGLFYLDDGSSKASVAASIAPTVGARSVQADVVLDATPEPAIVRANLNSLVAIAKRKGTAIGMASGLPEHLSMIASFAAELDRQGIALVPVNAIVGGANAVAAAK